MSNDLFQLITVTRVLPDGVFLAEALGYPEISALGDREQKWRACLQAKTKQILEDADLAPALTLHGRRLAAPVEVSSLDLTFSPPRRVPDWEQPLEVRIHYVHWSLDDLFHAFVPGLDVRVFATRASLLVDRVEAHVRLLLAARSRHLDLRHLAELARVSQLQIGGLEVTANRKTPKQIAAAGDAAEEKSSALEKLAEELPPFIPKPGEAGKTKPAQADGQNQAIGAAEAAYELETELQQLADALASSHRRSILIVGPPGCGKTSLVRELARRRKEFGFGQTAFWSTSGARLMTGPIGFGMWQERCQQMCREISKAKSILHLNNLGELLEVGKASRGQQSAGSFIRPWIARGEVLAIAECTPEQIGVIERNEPHLLGAFQQFVLAERTPEQTREILSRVLAAAPGGGVQERENVRALRVGEEERRSGSSALPEMESRVVRNERALARLHQLHQRYATYSANPGRPLRFLKNLLADRFPDKQLDEAQVIDAFSRETGLPRVLLDDEMPLDPAAANDWFARRVIGQPDAAEHVVNLLLMIKARLARPRKPLGSFLFIGPTGTGKTEMAKALAAYLFGDPGRLVRFDMNEFGDSLSVQRLIGGAGTGSEGLLTARIREQPFSVVLLDEFEKADPAFFDLLLQILGEGRLTDAEGRVADFCNNVIVMTSNLGAEAFQRGRAGFQPAGRQAAESQSYFAEAVRKFLRPEIYNRIDAIVPFHALSPEIVRSIAQRHLELLRQRDGIRLRPIEWQMQEPVAEHLASTGYSHRYGARPLKRALEQQLLVPLAEELNRYQEATLLKVQIGMAGGRIHIQAGAQGQNESAPPTPAEDPLAQEIVTLRRRIVRLEHCVATSKLEDEVVMLESLERRLKAMGLKPQQLQARVANLPKLRECLAAVSKLSGRARNLETESLGILYQRQSLDAVIIQPELYALNVELQRLKRDVFRRQHKLPDDCVLAFYSEHQETLMEFALAYHQLGAGAGKIVGLDYFTPPPGGRSAATKLLRKTPEKPENFFKSPPEKLVGIIMHLRGEFFESRFQPEAGLHFIREKKIEYTCLIESGSPPFGTYEPPAEIDRPGTIAKCGAPPARVFDREKNTVSDGVLGRRPWVGAGLREPVEELTAQRLELLIERATQ